MMNRGILLLALVVALSSDVHAQLRAMVVARGLVQPVAFVADPLHDRVFYVVEKGGLVKTFVDGVLQTAPFADFRSVVSTGDERGLLGMAFSPDVASGRVFFNFTDANGDIVISRAKRSPASIVIDPASRFDLLWRTGERVIRHPFENHYGGHLAFGPDGYLYIGLGDGGSPLGGEDYAQNSFSPHGKMLRIDVDVPDSHPTGYQVPVDNPFVDSDPIAALPEIWSFGLRNPWRYSFDDVGPGATGALLIGDVGQHSREEINYEPFGSGGRNYGWRVREGRIATPGIPPGTPAYLPLTEPLLEYEHEGRSVSGGFVYRGRALGATYQGRYFFADFASARLFSVALAVDGGTGEAVVKDAIEHTAEIGPELGGRFSSVTSFGRDPQGELYLVTYAGTVLKLVPGDMSTSIQVNATVDGDMVTISWKAADTVGVTGYQLEAGYAPGTSDAAVLPTGAGDARLTFTDVPAGTYYVRVRTVRGGRLEGPSNEIVVVVPRT
jgi:glucose/arabinose dehydrogenase